MTTHFEKHLDSDSMFHGTVKIIYGFMHVVKGLAF